MEIPELLWPVPVFSSTPGVLSQVLERKDHFHKPAGYPLANTAQDEVAHLAGRPQR